MHFQSPRIINVLNQSLDDNRVYPLNSISTTKYNLLNFLPVNLFEQFHRIANIWFLIVSILQLLPFGFSPFASWGTIVPLCLILCVSMSKDYYNFIKRLKSDSKINNRKAQIIEEFGSDFTEINWASIRVGSIIKLSKDEQVPADIIVLCTGDGSGNVYIETSNLDGENDFKKKFALRDTKLIFGECHNNFLEHIGKLKNAKVQIEQPSNSFERFSGSLELKEFVNKCRVYINNLVLRGSKIKNVETVYGLVVFTGPDTKLMLNTQLSSTRKHSSVEVKINKYLYFIFSKLFLFTLVTGMLSVIFYYKYPNVNSIYGEESSNLYSNFFTILILYNNFVPISLYVTLDFVRIIQAKIIESDKKLQEKSLPIVKNTDLNEELGQVEYIFTDKTGTLTENVMEFKRCWINGRSYGKSPTKPKFINYHPKFNFEDDDLINVLDDPSVQLFFQCLGICHTVKCDTNNNYQAVYPDEEALVIAAHSLGFTFRTNNYGLSELKTSGETLQYSQIGVNEFSSERKRMSIVIKFYQGQGMLICKGADSVILPRLSETHSLLDIIDAIDKFSQDGLRTLVYAFKYLNDEELREYDHKYKAAKNSMADQSKILEKIAEEFEKDLEIVGISAVEDKLQEGTAETIQNLRQAGIKFWMLTGDRKETAENIAYASNLIDREKNLIEIKEASSLENIHFQLMQCIVKNLYQNYYDEEIDYSFDALKRILEEVENFKIKIQKENELVLSFNGKLIDLMFKDATVIKYFCMLAACCTSVVCYRISPFQKSQLVKLIRNHLRFKPVILAIGDGSNDVCMIQYANIGVGLMGQEGMQAANSSDFAISKFKELERLLLHHGRLNYSRISRVVLISFFKNSLLVLPMFYYTFFDNYSGNSMYDSWLIITFNMIMTSVPVAIMGFLDKSFDYYELEKQKKLKRIRKYHDSSQSSDNLDGVSGNVFEKSQDHLYARGIYSSLLNPRKFFEWFVLSVICSVTIYFFSMYGSKLLGVHGFNDSYIVSGTIAFIMAVITTLMASMIITYEWTVWYLGSIGLSFIALILLIVVYDFWGFPTTELIGISNIVFISPKLILLIITTTCLNLAVIQVPRYFVFVCKRKNKSVVPYIINRNPSNYFVVKLGKRLEGFSDKLSEIFLKTNIQNLIKINEEENSDEFKRAKFTLKFFNTSLEYTYTEFRNDRGLAYMKKMLLLLFFGIFVWNIFGAFSALGDISQLIARLFLLFLIVLVIFGVFSKFFRRYYKTNILLMIIGGLTIKSILEFVYSFDGSMSTATASIIVFIIFRIDIIEVIIIWSFYLIIYLSRVFSMYSKVLNQYDTINLVLNYSVILIGITIISIHVGFSIENSNRLQYIMMKKTNRRYDVSGNILSRLLPHFVIDIVKKKQHYFTQEHVTIMFCEICNFDKICANYSPTVLIDMLNKFTLILDNLCDNFGITKIETVNKTYVACGGIKDFEKNVERKHSSNHAIRIVELALEIVKTFNSMNLPEINEKFSIKIGINSGEIIAGVVGDHKPQFSLVGDTINIASRMCSTIKTPDTIRISSTTFDLIQDNPWICTEDFTHFKGRNGPVKTYFVKDKQRNLSTKSNGFGEINVEDLLQNKKKEVIESPTTLFPNEKIKRYERRGTNFEIEFIKSNELLDEIYDDDEDENFSDDMISTEDIQWNVISYFEFNGQKYYRINFIKRNLTRIKWGLYMTIVIYMFLAINYMLEFFLLESDYTDNMVELVCVMARIFVVGTMSLITYNLETLYPYRSFQWVMVMNYTIVNLIIIYSNLFITKNRYYLILESMYINVAVNHISGMIFGYILIVTITDFFMWLMIASALKIPFFDEIFFIVFFLIINTFASFYREFRDRKIYNLRITAKLTIRKTEKLLDQMIPESVYERLSVGNPILDELNNITILYADICGFTKYSEKKQPKEVIKVLSKIFTEFERLSIENKCFKVHTIGDCFVALGLSNFGESDHIEKTENVVKLAISMAKYMREFKFDSRLKMRIGIHTGVVIAGIVGTKIVRYDIYGPDVDIANSVESSGASDKINVSETTKNVLENVAPGKYLFNYNKIVHHEPTNKHVPTYFLTQVEPKNTAKKGK